MINNDYSLLPINVGLPSFVTSSNYKHLAVINTVVVFSTSQGLAQKGNGYMNRCLLLYKYTTYSKVWQSKNRMAV